MEFVELNLNSDLQKSLSEAGYITAMPVQEQVLQKALDGADVYVQSQTGTGKTAAYLIVMMQRMLTDPLLSSKKALIMVPTRELAVQVEDEAKLIGKYLPFKTASFYGGVGYGAQQASLRDDAQILVGTPGRVLDLCSNGYMNLFELAFLILDEADRMFDMGFYPDLRKLIQLVPSKEKRQTMLFSATLNVYVKNLALEYTKEPVEIEIEPEKVTVEEIKQILYHVPSEDKFRLLLGILEREKPETVLIFCNTKRYTEIVSRRLSGNGYQNEYISGDLPQIKRLKIIENMKAGQTPLLVATDVAARGLDIEGLDLVVNYDLPAETENYVHRIGRTARAGKSGKAITFASEQDVYELAGIEKFIGMKIPSEVARQEDFIEDRTSGGRGFGRGGGFGRRPRGGFGGERRGGFGDERCGGFGGERRGGFGGERREREYGSRPSRLPAFSSEERAGYYRPRAEEKSREDNEGTRRPPQQRQERGDWQERGGERHERGDWQERGGRRQPADGRRAEESGRRAEESGRRAEESGRRAEESGRRAEEGGRRDMEPRRDGQEQRRRGQGPRRDGQEPRRDDQGPRRGDPEQRRDGDQGSRRGKDWRKTGARPYDDQNRGRQGGKRGYAGGRAAGAGNGAGADRTAAGRGAAGRAAAKRGGGNVQQKPAKQGFLARVLGLFKKKEGQ